MAGLPLTVILLYLAYKALGEPVLGGIVDNTNQRYLENLRDYLKKLELRHERREISEEEYERLASRVRKTIGVFADLVSQRQGSWDVSL